MTLQEIENLLLRLQQQVISNTAAITSLTSNLSDYATEDDLNALTLQIRAINQNISLLSTDLNVLHESVKRVDNLNGLLDVSLNNLTEGDILRYGGNGLWYNTAANIDGSTSTGGVSKLSQLSDVLLLGVSDGQGLVYSSASGKWVNKTVSSGSNGTNMSNYYTKSETNDLLNKYLPLAGGTVEWLNVNGLTTINDNLLVKGGITMYNE